MEKTLRTIRTLSNIGRVLSKIIFIICCVSGGLLLVSILCLALGLTGTHSFMGIEMSAIIETEAGMPLGNVYGVLASGICILAAEAVLCKFAERYFKHELAAGTPFTLAGAKEMKRLGILAIVLPLAGQVASAIALSTAEVMTGVSEGMEVPGEISLSMGIIFLVMAVVLRYGAELLEVKNAEDRAFDENVR